MHSIQQPFCRGVAGRGGPQFPPQQIPFQFSAFPNPNPNHNCNPIPYLLQQNPNFLPHHFNSIPSNYTGFPQIQPYFNNNIPFPVQSTRRNGFGNHQPPPPPMSPPLPPPPRGDVHKEKMVDMLDKAAGRAWRKLLASKENVSAWVVSLAALEMVEAPSWESLGIEIQDVPSLYRLLATEGKINAFIHCFVGARRISSLYDLEMAICENEGVKHFEELELGPLVRHPLAVRYYSVTSDVTKAYGIRTEDVIFHLCEIIDTHKKKEITVDAFLDFIATKLSVCVREKLCIRIKNLGICIQDIQKAKQSEFSKLEKCIKHIQKTTQSEDSELEKCNQHVQKATQSPDSQLKKCNEKLRISEVKCATKSNTNIESKCEPKSDEGGVKQPHISVQEKELDNHFTEISEEIKSFSSPKTQFCGKHIRFIWSSSDDDDDTLETGESGNDQSEYNTYINPISVPSFGLDRVSSCPYPSTFEERKRLGLKNNADTSPLMCSNGVRCNTDKTPRRKKRKYEHMNSSSSLPAKPSKKSKLNVDIKNRSPNCRGITSPVSTESLRMCVTIGKDAWQVTNADEVITHEMVYYSGTAENSFIYSLLDRVLPYAQRYIYGTDPDKYLQLKHSCFHSNRNLKIFVVEKLYYQTLINKHKTTSSKRKKCNCLLQDNILYCKQKSDPQAIFLGLSCLFYNGKPRFHLADFLHKITTMAVSGKTEKQIEKLILNRQKMPQLPSDESCWTLENVSSSGENSAALLVIQISEQSSSCKKCRTTSNSQHVHSRTELGSSSPTPRKLKKLRAKNDGGARESNLEPADPFSKDTFKELDIEDDLTEITPGPVLPDAGLSESKLNVSSIITTSSTGPVIESVDLVGSASRIPLPSNDDSDQVKAQQAMFTGRLGELVAFKYFSENENQTFVKWVNETSETGLPYDIILGDGRGNNEYVEVKSTASSRKNLFQISMRDWQFAVENGGAFSIARVVLTENDMAKVTIYKNPARLIQLGNLKLAVVVPKQ